MLWYFWLFATIFTWGSYNVFYKVAVKKIDPSLLLLIAGLSHFLSALIWVFAKYIRDEQIVSSAAGLYISILLGTLMTLGGITFYYTFKAGAPVLAAIPAYNVGVVIYGVIIGVVFYSEDIAFKMILGVIFGIISFFLLTSK